MTHNAAMLATAVQALKSALPPTAWCDDPDRIAPHLSEWRDRYVGRTALMLQPGTVEEVALAARLCHRYGVPLVPQSGNTGLVGGGVPTAEGNEILLWLGRLNRIRDVNAADYSMVAEAGVTLVELQDAARTAGRLFPLSIASQGSARLGGLVATNAGGVHVLRYGVMRDLVLGLEVVLADGTTLEMLNRLRKNNAGYDLKQLFVGSEGTLGIVTAAALKLFPAIAERSVAMLAMPRLDDAIDAVTRLREALGEVLNAAELLPRAGMAMVIEHRDGRDPFPKAHRWYVLIELASSRPGSNLDGLLEEAAATLIDRGIAEDIVIAQSQAQENALWDLRERLSEAQKYAGGSIKHDIAVPIGHIPDFIARAGEALHRLIPDIIPVAFGHLGDGNIHYNLTQPPGMDRRAFLARWDEVNRLVHDIVADYGGSIAAEHGIGIMKRGELARLAPPATLELMGLLKHGLDPKGILNPGRVLRPAHDR